MRLHRFIASSLLAVGTLTGSMATAGVIPGSAFNAETEILELGLGAIGPIPPITLLDVTVIQSGNALIAADPDVALAQVVADVDLGVATATLDLGVLGVEWVDPNTFDLVFGLTPAEVTLFPGTVLEVTLSIPISVVNTIDWVLSDLQLGPNEIIKSVMQIDNGNPLIPSVPSGAIAWTDNSISITTDALVDVTIGANARSRFTMETAVVPVPAAGILLVGALAGLGGLRLRRRASTG